MTLVLGLNLQPKLKSTKRKWLILYLVFQKKKLIGFGSSARSQTFLNFCGLDQNNIDLIIDNNPLKQNLYSPGTNIKIVNFQTGIKSKPDAIFILAWNFKNEIIKECRLAGYEGNFIIPFPSRPEVL